MLSIKLVKKHKYYIFLLLIGVILSVFYYFKTTTYCALYHFCFEYYPHPVIINYYLKQFDFKAALFAYLYPVLDKVLILRALPFFLIFGPSQFLYAYSNFFYNYGLLILLFYSLTKIMDVKKAFLFTLFILSNSFFLEFLNLFYLDLNYFLTCSIFFVYLSIFKDNYKKHNILLVFLVTLLFLTKAYSYLIVPSLSFSMCLYFFLTKKKEKYLYIFRFFLIIVSGFFLFFLLSLGFNYFALYETTAQCRNECLTFKHTLFFIHKFPNIFSTFLLYFLVIYNYIRRRNLFFIFLFIFSEIFLIIFFNFVSISYFDIKLFFPFYLIYLFFFFDFIYSLIKRIFKKRYNYAIFLLILILFTYNFFNFFIIKKNSFEIDSPLYNIAFFLESSPVNKKTIFISTDGNDFFGGVPFQYNFVSGKNYSDNALSYLKELEPLYRFQIIDSFYPFDPYAGPANRNPDADYVICIDCGGLNLSSYSLDFKYNYSDIEKYVVSVYKNKNFNSTKENQKLT